MPTLAEAAIFLPILTAALLLAYRVRSLDGSGVLVAIVVGLVSYYAGGWTWFGALIFFFLVSSLLTKYRYVEKHSLGYAQEKGGARGWRNVLANGGIALFLSFNEVIYGGDIFSAGFFGAVAAAFADTLGTEVGLLSKSAPRYMIPPFRAATRGESGAVSGLGLLAGLAGALSFGILAAFMGVTLKNPIVTVFAILAGGFAGTLFDSLLGSALQASGKCVVCGKKTEYLSHHGKPIKLLKGIRFFENNAVNFVSTAFGAFVSVVIFLLL